MKIGFTIFKDKQFVIGTQELLATLTSAQKTGILNSFAARDGLTQAKHKLHIRKDVIHYFYDKIDDIQIYSAQLMRGQTESGSSTKEEKVYIISPAAQSVFMALVINKFKDDFNEAQITAILMKMIQCYKEEESGTWTFYKTEIIK